MKRLAGAAKVLVALFAINFAAIIVVMAMMMSRGMLTRDRLAAAVEALRGPPAALEGVEEGAATRPAAPEVPPPPISLADRSRAVALVRAELDCEIEDIRQRSQMVETERIRLEGDRAALEVQRKAFLESTDAVVQAKRRAGLRQLLKTLSALKAPRIKALVEKHADDDLAEILIGLEPRLRGKVIDEFKTSEELERMRTIIDLIRQGVGSKVSMKTAAAEGGSSASAL